MISKNERVAIKKFFGVGFAQKITDLLKIKGFKNRNKEHFRVYSVADVLNGKNSTKLEGYVITVWEEQMKIKKQKQEKRLELAKEIS